MHFRDSLAVRERTQFGCENEDRKTERAPDLFLHAARTMATAAAGCVVVEDSPFGVQAAKTAGMRVHGCAAPAPVGRLSE